MSNPTRNPTNPSNPPEPEPATVRTDHSDDRWRVSDPKTRRRRVEWRVFFSKTRATRPDRRYIQIRQYPATSKRDLVRSGDIQVRFGEIRRHLRRSKRDLVRSGDIRGDPSEIWWDPATFEEIQARFRPYLVRSGEIRGDPGWFRRFLVQIYWIFADSGDFFEDSGDVCKIRRLSTPTEPTEHHPNPKPTRPSDAGGRFRVPPPSTRRRRIGSGLGPKPTRPDPWTALIIIILVALFMLIFVYCVKLCDKLIIHVAFVPQCYTLMVLWKFISFFFFFEKQVYIKLIKRKDKFIYWPKKKKKTHTQIYKIWQFLLMSFLCLNSLHDSFIINVASYIFFKILV